MMRGLTTDQINLYNQYARLSEKAVRVSFSRQEKLSLHEHIWELISKEGVWRLPISKQYGGYELSWQDCIVALDGLFSNFSDIKCLTLFISQLSSLYLVSRYGTESVKKRYLSRLIKGEIACLVISENIYKSLPNSSCLNAYRNQTLYMKSKKILIHAKKNEDDIVFYINDKKLFPITVGKWQTSTLDEENKLTKEHGLTVLHDLIYFERLFYGIFTASFVERNIRKISQVFK